MKNILMILWVTLLLNACGGGSTDTVGLTPLPEPNDLKNELLVDAINKYLQDRAAPPNSEYDYVRTDLNGDGNREGIVLFKLPHTYWCGWDGCGMLIFKAGTDKFTPLSTISNVRGPIYIDRANNNGWRDVIIRISGTSMKDRNVVLKNNGSGYPKSPLLAATEHRHISTLNVEKRF